jgi:hypothetical protein
MLTANADTQQHLYNTVMFFSSKQDQLIFKNTFITSMQFAYFYRTLQKHKQLLHFSTTAIVRVQSLKLESSLVCR